MKCQRCCHRYTPEPHERGYGDDVRQQALRFYVDGMNVRKIARHLGIHHKTVSLWVKAHAASLPAAPVPDETIVIEADELYTFSGDKKTKSTS